MKYSINLNQTFNSLEVEFNEKPSKSIIEALKDLLLNGNAVIR